MSGLFRVQAILLVISISVVWLIPLLALAVRADLWGYKTAFSLIAGCAITAAIVLAVAGVSLIGAIRQQNQKAKHRSMLVILILIVPLGTLFSYGYKASQAPVIHDISTDTINPPLFFHAISLRSEDSNSLEVDESVIALQTQHYPDIVTLKMAGSKKEVLGKAKLVSEQLGWEVLAIDDESGQIEATHTSFWFGFVDDIVIRVTENKGAVLVDVRSASRVGKSDLGKNAERIRAFLNLLQ